MILKIKRNGFISNISAKGEVEFSKDQESAKNFYAKTGQRAITKAAKLFGKSAIVTLDVKHAPRGRNGGRRSASAPRAKARTKRK